MNATRIITSRNAGRIPMAAAARRQAMMLNAVARPTTCGTCTCTARSFSSTTTTTTPETTDAAIHKLHNIMEEYRQENYAQTTSSSRFKNQVTRAAIAATAAGPLPPKSLEFDFSSLTVTAAATNHPHPPPPPCPTSDEVVAMDGLQRVLVDIHAEDRLDREELNAIFEEMGSSQGEIPAHSFYQIL